MRIPIIITFALLSMVPNFTTSQEAPLTEEQTEQQVDKSTTQEPSTVETAQPTEEQNLSEESSSSVTETAENPSEEQQAPTEDQPAEEPAEDTDNIVTENSTVTEEDEVSVPTEEQEITSSSTETTSTSIPTAPKPVEDEEIVIPEEESELETTAGIDTVSLENPQGNWLFKRIWWERAEERYEKIRQLVDAIWESRTVFFVKRNELDRGVLDPFYLNVGIGQGELQAILAEINDFLEKKREQEGDLSEQERILYDSYITEEETLKQLKSDVESITQLDHSIDDALGTLMNQINRVRQFEEQAWQNFREIARILNDTKARELYYIIEGAARNIKNISTYLERDFLNHFTTLISEATKHVSRVQSQIEALKEKGIHFKRQVDLLQENKQTQQDDDEDDNDDDEDEPAPKPKLGWFGWIMSGIKGAFNTVLGIIMIPYNMLFGK